VAGAKLIDIDFEKAVANFPALAFVQSVDGRGDGLRRPLEPVAAKSSLYRWLKTRLAAFLCFSKWVSRSMFFENREFGCCPPGRSNWPIRCFLSFSSPLSRRTLLKSSLLIV
jgi:hypothetical protein